MKTNSFLLKHTNGPPPPPPTTTTTTTTRQQQQGQQQQQLQRQQQRKTKYALLFFALVVCFYLGLVRFIRLHNAYRPLPASKAKDIWSDACPSWPPPSNSGQVNQTLQFTGSEPSQETADMLTRILRERLESVKDKKMPDFSKACDVNSPDLPACTSYNCKDKISTSLEERVNDVLKSPELQLTNEHRAAIAAFSKMFPTNDIIIVSATSSNHFGETQKMFKSLHEEVYPRLKHFSVVLVDIGLTEMERKRAEEKCKCHVVRFPYHLFPAHVKVNNCYSFKPLSVLAAIQKARRMVIWQDSSVRWTSGIEHIMQRAELYGSQIIRYEGSARVTAHTLRQPFDYMKREVCAFTTFPEIEACAQIHKNDPVTLRLVLEPWARCGLERCCICPVSPGPVLPCVKKIAQHRCQRFDQSALTMVLARLLDKDFQKLVMPNEFEQKPILYKLGGDELHGYF
ncbi:MetK_1 protein [Elysia marginata]|uniref:MetK_1 protein n=1 Tax=Elysia marginata TaxID=1093978 RepID=A0AAV4EV95_9GAST|nr:MetK_1 protein [Elysia marginata]